MKQSNSFSVYIALLLLIFSVIFFNVKEGLLDDLEDSPRSNWLNFSSWFTTTPNYEIRERQRELQRNNDDKKDNKKDDSDSDDDDNLELTSNEKTYTQSALTKLISKRKDNEMLISCINKIKIYL
jgi:hypothetical protein